MTCCDPGAIKTDQWSGESLTYMARFEDGDAVPYLLAEISSIVVKVTNSKGVVTLGTTAIDPATTWFDVLQTTAEDAAWKDKDAIGYNFKATITEAAFPAADLYSAVITVTPVAGAGAPMHGVIRNTTSDTA